VGREKEREESRKEEGKQLANFSLLLPEGILCITRDVLTEKL